MTSKQAELRIEHEKSGRLKILRWTITTTTNKSTCLLCSALSHRPTSFTSTCNILCRTQQHCGAWEKVHVMQSKNRPATKGKFANQKCLFTSLCVAHYEALASVFSRTVCWATPISPSLSPSPTQTHTAAIFALLVVTLRQLEIVFLPPYFSTTSGYN